MEFHDYQRFEKKMIARRYQDDPESGTELVATVVLLEDLKRPDASLFSIVQPTSPEQRLRSVRVEQTAIERAAEGQATLKWPPVQSGKTAGLLSMYISVDRAGRVREAYPLNSDNPGLQDSARDQLLKWRVKPIVLNGRPIQAEAALSFHFETTLSAPPAQPAAGAGLTAVATASIPSPQIQVSPGVLQAFLLAHPEPVYPAAAKERKIQGKVVVALTVDRTGATKDIRVLSSPDQTLTDSAIAAVSQWRYTPYKLNGVTVDAQSTVEVNFKLP